MLLHRRLAALVLGVGLVVGVGFGPAVAPARAAPLRLCGVVSVYVPPTLLGTGLLTVGAIPFVVSAGVQLPADVAAGADLCFDLTTDPLGLVTGAAVTANVTTTLAVCASIDAYTAPSASADGRLVVGGVARTVAAGARVDGRVKAGVFARLTLTIDGIGRVSDAAVLAVGATLAGACGGATPAPLLVLPSGLPAPTGPLTPPGPSAPPATAPPATAPPAPSASGGAAPGGSPTAGSSARPSPSAIDVAGTEPRSSPSPIHTASPRATPSPSGSPAVTGPRDEPDEQPDLFPVNVVEDAACPARRTPRPVDGLADAVPDPASMSRTATVVASNAVPLLGIGLGVLLVGWLGSLRRRLVR